jgi:hypothetical protein
MSEINFVSHRTFKTVNLFRFFKFLVINFLDIEKLWRLRLN